MGQGGGNDDRWDYRKSVPILEKGKWLAYGGGEKEGKLFRIIDKKRPLLASDRGKREGFHSKKADHTGRRKEGWKKSERGCNIRIFVETGGGGSLRGYSPVVRKERETLVMGIVMPVGEKKRLRSKRWLSQ